MNIVRYATPFPSLLLGPSPFRRTVASPAATPVASAEVRDGKLEVTVDLPGVPSDAVSVEVVDRSLTIKVEHTTDRGELRWARSVRLHETLDADATVATYADGRLTVTVPSAPKPEPRVVKVELTKPQPPKAEAVETEAVEAKAGDEA